MDRDAELIVVQLLDSNDSACYRAVHRTCRLKIGGHVDIHARAIVTCRSGKVESVRRDIESGAIFWRKLRVEGADAHYLLQI